MGIFLPLFMLWVNPSYRSIYEGGMVPTFSCQPAGYLSGDSWTFVGIDLRVRRQLSFAQAKGVDLVWS